MILACVGLHVVLLRFFLDQSAFIERRPDWRRAPVQIEILAEEITKPAEPPPQIPKRTEPPKKVVSKPIYRPKPAVIAKPASNPGPSPDLDSRQSPETVSTADNLIDSGVTGPTGAGNTGAGNTAISSDSIAPSGDRSPSVDGAGLGKGAALPATGTDDRVASARAENSGLLFGKVLPAPPPSGKWNYSIHMGDFDQTGSAASLKLGFENHGTAYSLRAEVNATGITALFYGGVRRDLSRGRLTANGFEPERYAEQRNKGAERASQVDYARKQILFAGGESEMLPDGIQDRLSSLFQLGLLARADPDLFQPGKTVELPELNLRNVERISYRVVGPVNLKTSLGILRTLHLTRLPVTKGKDPEIELWLDYEFDLLPVRIRLSDPNGRVIDQVIDAR